MLLIVCDTSDGLKGLIKGTELLGNFFCSQVVATSDRCAKPWCTLFSLDMSKLFVCCLILFCTLLPT